MLTPLEITSDLLGSPRKVWVQSALDERASDCFVFLDAELYMDRVKAPGIMGDLQTAGRLAPADCVYVSNQDAAARHADYTCNERYASFLVSELCRWIEQNVGSHERLFLCGLSLSGLSAAFTAFRHPAAFSGVLCQSPSAWWNDEWLAASVPQEKMNQGRFWISVGDQELQEGVSHPPSGLFQKTSQLDSVRRLSQKLSGVGKVVHHAEYAGGHDPACWAGELPGALSWLTQNVDAVRA